MIIEQLSSLSDDFADVDLWQLTNEELRALTVAAHRARSSLDELTSRLTGAVEDRGLPHDDGATSTTAWLAATSGSSKREASRFVSLSRLTSQLVEPTRLAWSRGDITTEQVSIIFRAIDSLPEWLGEEERTEAQRQLLAYADEFAADDLKRLANRILEVIDPDGVDEILGAQLEQQEKRAFDATRVHFTELGDGITQLKALLPTTQADMLRTALEGLASPRRRHLASTDPWAPYGEAALGMPDHSRRLGWALCELIEHLPADALPQAGGLAASVTVDVDLKCLLSGYGLARTSADTDLSIQQTRRLVCNALLVPVLTDGSSKTLDVNPAKRLHDRYQRVALAKRDGGCCWKGCDRPPSWCEAHHLIPFSQDGPTTVDNGALFCFVHHHLLHDSDWSARLAVDGVVEVIPPKRIDQQQRPLRHARYTKLQPRAA